MRGAYAIARHEFLRRWPLILVGAGLGLVPYLLSRGEAPSLSELANTLATLAVVVCWIVAFTTGMSLIGRPLHDGRLSFYFTRPISAPAIAIGKVAGGLLAVTCMHVVLALPLGAALAHREPGQINNLAESSTFVGSGFFVVGLVVGILARSRSRWFLIDALGAAVAAVIGVAMFAGFGNRKLVIAQDEVPNRAELLIQRADSYLYGLVGVAAVAFLVTVVVAVTRGRTDRELVHRGVSLTLWPALTAIGLAGVCLARWGLR